MSTTKENRKRGNADGGQDYSYLSIKELKRLLDDRGIGYRDCIEKRDLVERLTESRNVTPKSDRSDANPSLKKKLKISDKGVGKSLLFTTALGENEINQPYKNEVSSCSKGLSCAIANGVMSKGKHYATFQRSGCQASLVHIGVMRPGLKLDGYHSKTFGEGFSPIFDSYGHLLQAKASRWGSGNVHACMRLLEPGKKNGSWSDGNSCFDTKKDKREDVPDWSEWTHCRRERVTLGLLLDLDAGSLSVYEQFGKDERKELGVLKTGLTGEYVWVVTIVDIQDGTTVRIKKGSVDDGSQAKISDFFKRA